jgi:hypothetical protein
MKLGSAIRFFVTAGSLTLANEVRVNQRLVDGDATQGSTDEEKYPN